MNQRLVIWLSSITIVPLFCVSLFRQDSQPKELQQGAWTCDLRLSQVQGKLHYAFTATELGDANKLTCLLNNYSISDEYKHALSTHFKNAIDNSKLQPCEILAVWLEKRPQKLDQVVAKLYDKTGCYITSINIGPCDCTCTTDYHPLGLLLPTQYKSDGEIDKASFPRLVDSWRIVGLPDTYLQPPIQIP